MTRIAEIFDMPERVHHGDFVLKLTEGVERADETLRDYVVTSQLVQSFEHVVRVLNQQANPEL